MTYQDFLASKAIVDAPSGFIPTIPINDKLFPFQRDIVGWGLKRGRAAFFEDCGLGKTPQQLEWAHQIFEHEKCDVLILAPLAVAEQTVREAKKFGIEQIKQCADQSEVELGITVTNYEKLHRFEASKFGAVALDESSILKSYTGKIRTQIIDSFKHTPYRSAWTATPAPNDYMELGNHAEFLGVMNREEMLATFFVHDGGDTSKWRLKKHAEEDFWRWLCSWAVNIRRPSDLGYDDGDFILPELEMKNVIVEADCHSAGLLFTLPASSLQERREARRVSLSERVKAAANLANSDRDQWLVWCDLNDESAALAKTIDGAVEVKGADSDEHKAKSMLGFASGDIRCLVTKGSIAGFGMNWQNSWKQIHCGVSDSHEELYQKIRRQYRFGQKSKVECYIITSNLDQAVIANLKRKQSDSDRMAGEMVKHMAEVFRGEIFKTQRITTKYNPTTPMVLPDWIGKTA